MNKRLTIRSFVTLFLAALLSCACLFGCSQAPSSESTSSPSAASSTSSSMMKVLVTIDPSAAEGKVDLPSDDLAIVSKNIELPEDASAYDALVATGAALEGSDAYVTSINGLAEKAAGPTYGWMYEVNEESPTVAASECVLQADDEVRWFYGSWDAS